MRSSACLVCIAIVGAITLCDHAVRAQDSEQAEIITEPPVESPASEAEPTAAPEVVAPVPPTPPPKEPIGHLRVGGGIGLGFGTDITFVSVSPQVSYIIKRIVEPGVALRYQYTRERLPLEDAIWHTFGASLFTRLYPIPSLFFLIEGEIINTGFRQGDFDSGRENYGNLFLGGGYAVGLGKGAFLLFALKVNVFRNPFYPSNFPIISFGAGYAF